MAIAVDATTPGALYAITRGRTSDPEGYYTVHLQRVAEDGTLQRVSKEPLPSFVRAVVVRAQEAFFVEPLSTSNEGLHPAKLWSVDLATGASHVVSTATVGAISDVTIDGDRLRWIEATDTSMAFFSLGANVPYSSVCALALA
jgi:hypothetical protein